MTGPMPGKRVGMIGLGSMGAPIAANLLTAGQQLTVNDADSAALQRFLDAHAGTGVHAATDFADREVVVLSLPDSDVVDAVVLGSDGLLASLAPGSVIVDMGSSTPRRTQELARRATERGIGIVDAPVSGGVARAREADLAVIVGGTDDDVEAVAPLLAATAREVIHVGPTGAGHAAKALNNLLSANGLFAAAETLIAARRFGIDPSLMLEVINAGSGRNQATETKFERFVLSRTFDSGFTAGLMNKDIGIALDLIREHGGDPALGGALGTAWASAVEAIGARADQTEIVRVLEHEAGVELTPAPTRVITSTD